jgi:hypothetical protein
VTAPRRVEVDPERIAGWVERFAARHGELSSRRADGGVQISAPDGAVATLLAPWGESRPVGPDPDSLLLRTLVTHAQRRRVVGLLLVRRGGFAVAVAEGANLVDSKVGSRYVQGKTKAGGWSQQRYARRRKAQAEEAFGVAADVAARILLPRLPDLEGLVAGGDRAAVRSVLADPRLRALADLPQGRFLAVPDPRQRVLEDAVRRSRTIAIDVHDPLRG